MSVSAAIDPDGQSPWWPCPECGGVGFRTVCTFERGRWTVVGPSEWRPFDPPSGVPTGVNVSEAECVNCGTVTNLAVHYGWPIEGKLDVE